MTATHQFESPAYRRETYFLARPYQNSTSSIALQVQRVLPAQPDDISSTFSDSGDARPGFEPILDIKRNRPPIKKLLRKVRSFSGNNPRGANAGSIIIPPPNARYSVTDFDKLRQACENDTNGSNTICSNSGVSAMVEGNSPASQQHLKTFSVYERDSPKLPLAQFSKNGVTFSQRTTPLVARHSRLDRQDSLKLDHDHSILPHHSSNGGNSNNNTNPLIGQVSWNLVEDRAQEYKVIDSSTNTVIGRWRLIDRHTKLTNLSSSSSSIIRESHASSAGGSSRRVATAVPSQPFYSGQAPHLSLSRDKSELVLDRTAVWCFVVKGTVLATLKGYELSVISHRATIPGSDEPETMTHKIVRDRLYLDEYSRALRLRLVAAANREGGSLPTNAPTSSLSRPLPSLPEQQQSTSVPSTQKKMFRRHSMPPIMTGQVPSLSPHQATASSKPPLPIFEESSALDQYVTNFNRLKLSDGIMISALSLMLNLDDKLAVFALRKKLLEEAAAQEQQQQQQQQQQRQQRSPRRKLDEVINEHPENENNPPPSSFASRLKRSWKMPNFAKIRVF